jgi:hypothetical protein
MKADPLSYSSINNNNGTRIRKEDLSFLCCCRYSYILAMKADPLSYSSININNGTRIRKEDLAFFTIVVTGSSAHNFPDSYRDWGHDWDSNILNSGSSK